ncbi:BMP family lipoprotein [Hespellia stercorisuis]|uniref:Nucleoside-binding protein n=1 Tax=Hespellia stercorisuis DSM 15480 TaxID=1121950 RepID=A0A1M6Q138_9FIRM|nr:BMP family ABC transporter substrate-binding protein [Hespellia stercorisuis]SHK13827.1 nucleoside-binding protein [Hespellia stercorisuis DSM 15480]
MKKKILSLLLAGAMVMGMAGCASKPTADGGSTKGSGGGYELALITDVGTIDDKSFNQGSWEGLEKYAKDNDLTCKYYKPSEKSDEACSTAIDLAVKGGAKVIVTPGFLFEVPILNAQTKYPDVTFVIIDAAPQDADGNQTIEKNVLSIFYAEQQAGYLAGYAAVEEGYTQLGFMGGIAVPAVIRYGYGFIEGADAAAKELGIADVNVKYTYMGNFDASPEAQTKAASWYKEGTQCIFACGGGVGNSVMKAAEAAGTYVIGVDVDQSSESDTVITSAMKNLGDSVYNAVGSYYDGSFEGGKILTLTAKENGIELPMDSSKFKVFNQEKYDALYAKLQDGTIKVDDDSVATDATGVPTEIVKVENIQ